MLDNHTYELYNTKHTKVDVNIKEHKAPTDDSIRLYEEIKEKCFKSIVKSIQPPPDNIVNYNGIYSEFDCNSYEKKIHYNFIINSEEITGIITIDRSYKGNVIDVIYKAIAEEITNQLLKRAYKDGSIENIIRGII